MNVTINSKKRSEALKLAICFLLQAITLKAVVIMNCLELDDEGNYPDE